MHNYKSDYKGHLKNILDVATLPFFNTRANASMVLERQLRQLDTTVSGFEKQLSDDGAIPDKPSAIQTHTQEIQVKSISTMKYLCCFVFQSLTCITYPDLRHTSSVLY